MHTSCILGKSWTCGEELRNAQMRNKFLGVTDASKIGKSLKVLCSDMDKHYCCPCTIVQPCMQISVVVGYKNSWLKSFRQLEDVFCCQNWQNWVFNHIPVFRKIKDDASKQDGGFLAFSGICPCHWKCQIWGFNTGWVHLLSCHHWHFHLQNSSSFTSSPSRKPFHLLCFYQYLILHTPSHSQALKF